MVARKVLIVHAEGEESFVEKLAGPLSKEGYEVMHEGAVLVGESVVEEASKVLGQGGAVVLCGTEKAVGKRWTHQLVNAAHRNGKGRILPLRMERDAYVESLTIGETIAEYWEYPTKAIEDLISVLRRDYPLDEAQAQVRHFEDAEERYRSLLLETCDIVNLANLPEQDRILVLQRQLELRRLYVPLRVWVDVETDEYIDEEIKLGDFWKEHLEKIGRKRQRLPVGERLAKAKRLVVLGGPGAGKSTLTRWIATAYLLRLKSDPDLQDLPDVKTLPDEDWLPIIVRCRDLDQSCISGNLDDILSHTLRKAELTEDEANALLQVLKRRLNDGTALLMLDGLDEISESRMRASFCQHLEQIHVAYPKAPIIATSRIVGYRDMGYRLDGGFEHVTLDDLDREEKDDFAHRWCNLTELPERRDDAARELIHDIHSSDRIERMTGNPMLLTTMALVKRKVGKLPSHRAHLYGEAVQVLLNWRSEVDEPLDQLEAIPQLEYIAYDMCDRGVQQLRRDEILELIAQMRIEYPHVHQARNHTPEEFLHLLEARTGLLVEAGRPLHLGMCMPVYEFRHLTFQEFLAATALVNGRFPGRDATRSLADNVAPLAGRTEEEKNFTNRGARSFTMILPGEVSVVENWREALRLCASICRDSEVDGVVRGILIPLAEEPEPTHRARAILAALCVADEPNVSEGIVKEVFQTFATQIKEDDGSWFTSTNISTAAIELSVTRWASLLCASLVEEFNQRDSKNRGDAGSLCGMIGAVFAPRDRAQMNAWLIKQVELIKKGDELDAIKSALTLMHLVREYYFAHSIQDFQASRLGEALLSRLSGSAPMTHAAAWTLGWLNRVFVFESGKNWRPEPKHIERILAFISKMDADPEAVRYLAWITGHEKIDAAVEPLLAWLDYPNSALLRSVTTALGNIGNERALEPLIARLEDQEADVRGAAAEALGNIGNERSVEPLIAKLNDPMIEISVAVAEALGRIGSERAVELLIANLEDPDAYTRRLSLQALSQEIPEIDRLLLSRDLDGLNPFLDPHKEISTEFASKAAEEVRLTIEEVKAHYEALAERFPLKLEWR